MTLYSLTTLDPFLLDFHCGLCHCVVYTAQHYNSSCFPNKTRNAEGTAMYKIGSYHLLMTVSSGRFLTGFNFNLQLKYCSLCWYPRKNICINLYSFFFL